MSTIETKLSSLLPDRDSHFLPAEKQAIAAEIQAGAARLQEREENAEARKLLQKARYYKKKYGEDFEPEFDKNGKFKEPLYDPNEVKLKLKTLHQEDDIRIVKADLTEKPENVMLTGQYAHLNSTSSPHIARLLKKLNIDQTAKLTKTDLSDLLSAVMMMNEKQLVAMQNNQKIPVVIRILIKALSNDMRIGNLDTVDRLWDRIFGKPTQQQVIEDNRPQSAISALLPGVTDGPVSREAYIMIREHLLNG